MTGTKEEFSKVLLTNLSAIAVDFYREERDGDGNLFSMEPTKKWDEALASAIKEVDKRLYLNNPGYWIDYDTPKGKRKKGKTLQKVKGFRNYLNPEQLSELVKLKNEYSYKHRTYLAEFSKLMQKGGYKDILQASEYARKKYGITYFK